MFDGTTENPIALPGDPQTIEEVLRRLDNVRAFFSDKSAWCKGNMQDKDGRRIRMCLEGGIQAYRVSCARLPILDAVEELYGKQYDSIPEWNDGWFRRFSQVRAVLDRARENVAAGKYELDALVLRF